MVKSSAKEGGYVFAMPPGSYRLSTVLGYTMSGTKQQFIELDVLEDPLPGLTVEIRKGEVAFLGRVNVSISPALSIKRGTKVEIVPDATRQQKLLLKLAEKASKTPWASGSAAAHGRTSAADSLR